MASKFYWTVVRAAGTLLITIASVVSAWQNHKSGRANIPRKR